MQQNSSILGLLDCNVLLTRGFVLHLRSAEVSRQVKEFKQSNIPQGALCFPLHHSSLREKKTKTKEKIPVSQRHKCVSLTCHRLLRHSLSAREMIPWRVHGPRQRLPFWCVMSRTRRLLSPQIPGSTLSRTAEYYCHYSFLELFNEAAWTEWRPRSAGPLSAALQEPLAGSCYCGPALCRQILAPTLAVAVLLTFPPPGNSDCINLPGRK